MALLQISEPGQAPDPHQRRIAVGIDLGTTHSLVAAVRHGVAECLPDDQGRVILPSAVRYLEGGGYGFLIGDGSLNYGLEVIGDLYYKVQINDLISVSAIYQPIVNPAYNRDRGPVQIFTARLHVEF